MADLMDNFKIGDRVVALVEEWTISVKVHGTIISLFPPTGILVEFDDILRTIDGRIFGHNGSAFGHSGKDGYCWCCDKHNVSLEPNNANQSSFVGYQRTSDGFLTNPDNWQPGKWLI